MSEITELPVITPEKAKAEITVAISRERLAIQGLQEASMELVFNEDQESINRIKSFLDTCKAINKAIDAAHEKGKAPHLQAGRVWDEAKRNFKDLIGGFYDPVAKRFADLCAEIDRKTREKAAKEARQREIRQGIESNILEYASRIAAAKTAQELVNIEKSINLQRTPAMKAKYGDLQDEAVALYDEKLLPLLKSQKSILRQLSELDYAEGQAQDMDQIMEIQGKKDDLEASVVENQIRVQEAAIDTTVAPKISSHEVVSPSVKARRTTVEFEILNPQEVMKKNPMWCSIVVDKDKVKEAAKTLEQNGFFKDKDEVISNGIRFYIKKLY